MINHEKANKLSQELIEVFEKYDLDDYEIDFVLKCLVDSRAKLNVLDNN